MGKKGNSTEKKKKLTKKEKKQQSHLKLIQGKKGSGSLGDEFSKNDEHKKSA